MKIRTRILVPSLVPSLALLLSACAPAGPAAEVGDALSISVRVAAAPGAQIVGTSADRRRIAYAAPCAPDATTTPRLSIYDDWTGSITDLGALAHCAPTAAFFSPDGQLAAFPR